MDPHSIPAPPPAPAVQVHQHSGGHQHGLHRKRASSYARGVEQHHQHRGHRNGGSASAELDDLNDPLEYSRDR